MCDSRLRKLARKAVDKCLPMGRVIFKTSPQGLCTYHHLLAMLPQCSTDLKLFFGTEKGR